MKSKIFSILIIIVIIVAIAIIIIRTNSTNKKETILSDIKTAYTNLLKSTNYSYELKDYSEKNNSSMKKMVKDEKIVLDLKSLKIYGNTKTGEVYNYSVADDAYTKFDEDSTKTYLELLKNFSNFPTIISKIMEDDVNIKDIKISEEKLNGTDCYVIHCNWIENKDDITWIDKNTMLPIKNIIKDEKGNKISEYEYTIIFGKIQDSDVTMENN